MSISFHLSNFPTLNQNHEPANPYPDVNSHMDCVPTSIAAALWWFTGTEYYGNEIIDQVYGSVYQGGTAASAYEDYCAARGISLFPINGTPAQLVQDIHSQVHQNRPVMVTVPGHWNDPNTSGQNPGSVTHVMVVCGDGPGSIQVMNPWTGAFEEYADSWFIVKLCYGQVWPMEKKMGVSWPDDGATLTAPNGVKVTGTLRAYIVENQWDDNNWPLAPAEHRTDILDGSGNAVAGTEQVFRGYGLWYKDAYDGIYLSWPGTELLAARTQIASLQAALREMTDKFNADEAKIAQMQQNQGQPALSPQDAVILATAKTYLVASQAFMALASSVSVQGGLVPVGQQTKPLPQVQ